MGKSGNRYKGKFFLAFAFCCTVLSACGRQYYGYAGGAGAGVPGGGPGGWSVNTPGWNNQIINGAMGNNDSYGGSENNNGGTYSGGFLGGTSSGTGGTTTPAGSSLTTTPAN